MSSCGMHHLDMTSSIMKYLMKTQKAGNPLAAYLMVNEMCNLKCNMCHIWQGVYVKEDETILSTQEIKNVIDQLAEVGLRAIILTGGEPFMRKDLIEILTYVNQKIPYSRMNSNATLITKELAEGLVKSGLDEIWLSLDGYGETHDKVRGVAGTFDRYVRSLELINKARRDLRSATPNVMLNMTVSKYNFHDILKVAQFGAQHDVREMLFSYVIDVDWEPVKQTAALLKHEDIYTYQWNSSENLFLEDHKISKDLEKELYEIGRKHDITIQIDPLLLTGETKRDLRSCYFMWLYTMISPHGYVIPCQMLDRYYLGNLRKDRFKDIWNSAEFQNIRKVSKNGLPICKECCIPRRNISDQMQTMANFKRVFFSKSFRKYFYKKAKPEIISCDTVKDVKAA